MTDTRECTCHPDDQRPVPCARKFALQACIEAASTSKIWRKTTDLRARLSFLCGSLMCIEQKLVSDDGTVKWEPLPTIYGEDKPAPYVSLWSRLVSSCEEEPAPVTAEALARGRLGPFEHDRLLK